MKANFIIGVDYFQHAFADVACCLSYPKNISDRCSLTGRQTSLSVIDDRIRIHYAGLACANRAMEILRVGYQVSSSSIGGRPSFPAGYIGSISHSCNRAVACAAERKIYRAVGIDIEKIQGDDFFSLGRHVLTRSEMITLSSLSDDESKFFFYLCFSAKEASFKAVSEFGNVPMNFLDYELYSWNHSGKLLVHAAVRHNNQGNSVNKVQLGGAWTISDGFIITIVAIKSGESSRVHDSCQ